LTTRECNILARKSKPKTGAVYSNVERGIQRPITWIAVQKANSAEREPMQRSTDPCPPL
jgi:hypothetical protein